jgi:flagellar export protein FliJ
MSTHDTYELEVLLELRQQEKGAAEDAYGEAVHALERQRRVVAEAETAVSRAVAERRQRVERFDSALGAGASLAEMQHFDRYLAGLKAKEEALQAALADATELIRSREREVHRRKGELIEATKALKAVEAHHQTWLEEQAVLMQRKEADRLDDIAARIWRENQR